MASQGYRDWVAAGRPYTLIRPAKDLQRIVSAYGLTVYTPFSYTGWPNTSRSATRWKGRALDIMPRADNAAGRAENAAIARQLVADKNAGVPGTEAIKYINWTDEKGVCTQERWMPHHDSDSSGDKDHIHVSFRDDMDTWTGAAGYDPVARMSQGVSFDMSARTEQIIEAWRTGQEKTGDGTAVAPVTWRIRDEAWQRSVDAKLDAYAAADELRDQAMLAVIQVLTKDGNASSDTILVALREVRDEARAKFAQLHEAFEQERVARVAAEARAEQLAAALAARADAGDTPPQ